MRGIHCSSLFSEIRGTEDNSLCESQGNGENLGLCLDILEWVNPCPFPSRGYVHTVLPQALISESWCEAFIFDTEYRVFPTAIECFSAPQTVFLNLSLSQKYCQKLIMRIPNLRNTCQFGIILLTSDELQLSDVIVFAVYYCRCLQDASCTLPLHTGRFFLHFHKRYIQMRFHHGNVDF